MLKKVAKNFGLPLSAIVNASSGDLCVKTNDYVEPPMPNAKTQENS